MDILNADILNNVLNLFSQSLTYPVIIILIIIVIFSIVMLGGLVSEYSIRKKSKIKDITGIIYQISEATSLDNLKEVISTLKIPNNVEKILMEIANSKDLNKLSREALTRKLVETEEEKLDAKLAKTDTITRIGPTLGLMGTLIPLGPGLASLGTGDVNALATSLTLAFNTTIVGVGSGALCYVISKIRRGWYDTQISDLDALTDVTLDFVNSCD